MFNLNLMFAQDSDNTRCALDERAVKQHCIAALEQQTLADLSPVDEIEISIQMLDKGAMRSLNAQFRNKDSSTNVLSFESDMPVLHDEQDKALLVLGDLVFCPDVIAAEALSQSKSEAQHWAHMVVHGALHLCGYDHVDPAEALIMEELEIQILSSLDVSNPYQLQAV